MYDRPVETYYGTADKAVTDKPTLVYWIFVDVTISTTVGVLYIRDGYSSSAPILAGLRAYYNRVSSFYPPIRCAHGLYIHFASGLTSYTVGYREEKDIPSLK